MAISTGIHPMRPAMMSGRQNPVESVSSFTVERIPTRTNPGNGANIIPQEIWIGLRVHRKTRVTTAQMSPPTPK